MLLLATAILVPVRSSASDIDIAGPYFPLHLSVFPPASIPWAGPRRTASLSLNLVYGRVSAVYGIEIGLINRVDRTAAGVQMSGLANWLGGDAWGLQVSGGINRVAGRCAGICVAGVNLHIGGGGGFQVGLVNYSGVTLYGDHYVGFAGVQLGVIYSFADVLYGIQANAISNQANDVYGMQVSLIANSVMDHFAGVQIASANINGGEGNYKIVGGRRVSLSLKMVSPGLAAAFGARSLPVDAPILAFRSYLRRKTQGIQVAFLFNIADDLQGVQFALLGGNLDYSQLAGVQLALLSNIAFFDANGLQASFLFNGARTLNGVQLGLVNVCRTLRGVQVGLVNVCRTLHGFQLGAINIAYRNRLPFMIGLNAGF